MLEYAYNIFFALKIADAKIISDILITTHQVNWTPGHSARVQADKILTQLALTKRIEKCRGFYRTLDCKSEYDTHARKLTQDLATILKAYPQSLIFREHTISEVGLRPDAIVLLRKEVSGLCLIYECVQKERPEYLTRKENIWKSWNGALTYLTNLFNYRIPSFTFVTDLKNFLKEIANE